MARKYENRKFVMVKPTGTKLSAEDEMMFGTLVGKVFERDRVLALKEQLVRGRKGYRSKGGTDYASLEASKCFANLLNKSVILEVKGV